MTNFPVPCGTAALQSPVFVRSPLSPSVTTGQIVTTSADGRAYRISTTVPPPGGLIPVSRRRWAERVRALASAAGSPRRSSTSPTSRSSSPATTRTPVRFVASGWSGSRSPRARLRVPARSVGAAIADAGASTAVIRRGVLVDGHRKPLHSRFAHVGRRKHLSGARSVQRHAVGTPAGFATLTRTGAAQTVATSPVTEFLTASSLAQQGFRVRRRRAAAATTVT